MKKYITHMKTKSAHERRQHAMRVSGFITAGVFAVWLMTLGVRLASPSTSSTVTVVAKTSVDGASQTAAVANSVQRVSAQEGNTLEVVQ